MTTNRNKLTSNIRISKQTHELLKQKCKEEGRIMSVYVDMVLKESMLEGRITKESRLASEG